MLHTKNMPVSFSLNRGLPHYPSASCRVIFSYLIRSANFSAISVLETFRLPDPSAALGCSKLNL